MIHRFQKCGLNFIVDTNSGAVHLPDGAAYDLAGTLAPPLLPCPADSPEIRGLREKHGDKAIDEAYAELFALYESGALFSECESPPPDLTDIPLKALCLHVSHDCNLRCGYCFASTGDFNTGRSLMPPETAMRAIDFIIEKSRKRRNIEIDFFGGEPLMAFDTVRKTVDYARSREKEAGKNFRFTITTNGVALNDEIIAYINREMSNVVISLDGRESVNDALRKTPDGRGSYAAIVPKFKALVDARGHRDYYTRGTFTARNLDFDADVLHMAGLGFKNLSVEPVVTKGPLELREERLPEIFAAYDRLCEALADREKQGEGLTFFHFMVDFERGPCAAKRSKGCGAGYEYAAITPRGDIYPCHQFVGMDGFRLGSIFDDSFDKALSERFAGLNIFTRKACQGCWAKFYCGGGCSASNFVMNGEIAEPYALGCEMEKYRLERAIWLKAVSQ